MAKQRSVFVCTECGSSSLKWLGRCPDCKGWGTLVEERVSSGSAGRPALSSSEPCMLTEVASDESSRISTSIDEFDRVLGGGIVMGSSVLIGGDQGIGKSTLLLQASSYVSKSGATVLYVTGEESVAQTKLRAERLQAADTNILVLAENDVDVICERIKDIKPQLVVIDSIQMVYRPDLDSAPGTVAQVRDSATVLVQTGKALGIPILIIGHVTKQGVIAGPRILEHIVDTVLYFEGDGHHTFRILRAAKNRFGSTNEIGVFEMRSDGLHGVSNPSEIFLGNGKRYPGSVVVPCVEGTRPVLVEIQALTSRANYGTPERRVTGADYNRVCMLLAVLEKRGGLGLGGQDVFVNVVSGLKVDEPAADLGIALAIASGFRDRPIPEDMAVTGELGLGGEVRKVSQMEMRLREAGKMGFDRMLAPEGSPTTNGVKIHEVSHISDALRFLD